MKKFYMVESRVTDKKYLEVMHSCAGQGMFNEITEDGNMEVIVCLPFVEEREIKAFNSCTPTAYSYELGGKSAVILDLKATISEVVINPTYYADERWDKFENGECKELVIYLMDSIANCIVAGKVFDLKGNMLEKFRKSFSMNASYTRKELDDWTQENIFSRNVRDNIKRSSYVGKCYESEGAEIVLV